MNVSLHHGTPDEPILPRIMELTSTAVRVDLAIAFVTKHGAQAVKDIATRLKSGNVRLLVSVLFPTDLDALEQLAEDIEVHVHLGRQNSAEKLHWQFHSKIALIEHRDNKRNILIGSHNWTRNGLSGGNLEGSAVVECTEQDPVVQQTRDHIEACRNLSERFDPSRINLYRAIQREFHQNLPSSEKHSFPGFEPHNAIVILAELDSKPLQDSGELYFCVPSGTRNLFRMDTEVQLYVFPKNTLFGKPYPPPQPRLYRGQVQGTDRRPSDPLAVGDECYFIGDLKLPRVRRVQSVPARSSNEMQVIVPFEREQLATPLPLFHGTEPQTQIAVDYAPEQNVYDASPGVDLKNAFGRGKPQSMVPTDLIERMVLKVPFRFAYPERLAQSLEMRHRSQERESLPVRVEVTDARVKSAYVSSVKYRSNRELTEFIHSPSFQ